MAEPAPYSMTWSDEQLPAAVAAATSWRGVMRELGLNPASGGTTRTVRRHAALLVDMPDGLKRVQVKTTTFKSKAGWLAQIGRRPYSIGNNALLVPYDPETIDLFFVVDGDLAMYLIPSRVVAGRVQILLRAYSKFIVGDAAGIMVSRPSLA